MPFNIFKWKGKSQAAIDKDLITSAAKWAWRKRKEKEAREEEEHQRHMKEAEDEVHSFFGTDKKEEEDA